ncbi:MAG TPA: hypothetical protein PLE19_17765 [Planctomycetota bacterium]|nr:hypothetical protein [Planctomycetota bacterium]HRR80883.1 hypothetical protein [Planctomycetota bacterium]HRT96097.1 hypothetical protein [Planctomycetota bacterium]
MGKDETVTTLGAFLAPLAVGEAFGHLNLTLVPLRGDSNGKLDYVLGADAIEAGTLAITEVGEFGTVPELLVKSTAETMVLLLDGEELVGAKQNRILNTSVLLPPKAETRIPVSCVEQGRWHHASRAFAVGGYSPSKLRARKSRDVSRSLRTEGVAASNQGAVWEEVSCCLGSVAAHSPTMALHDAIKQRQETLDGYTDALPWPDSAQGVVAAINGEFVAVDLFDKAETLRRVWPRLITGYVLDALGRQKARSRPFTPKGAGALLEHLGEVACQPCPSVGVGQDWRFESKAVVGQALVAEGVCVHMSVFPNQEASGPRRGGASIEPPSGRGRRKRSP